MLVLIQHQLYDNLFLNLIHLDPTIVPFPMKQANPQEWGWGDGSEADQSPLSTLRATGSKNKTSQPTIATGFTMATRSHRIIQLNTQR